MKAAREAEIRLERWLTRLLLGDPRGNGRDPEDSPSRGRSVPTGVWPSPRQKLALQAALLEGDAARRAWLAWQAHAAAGHAGNATSLAGLIYENLKRQGIALGQPFGPLFMERHALTWGVNRGMLHTLAGVLRALQEAAIPTLVLKGAALAVTCYRDLGLRPMGDVDVLVPLASAHAARELLKSLGYRPNPRDGEQLTEGFFRSVHSHAFGHPKSIEIDLHWHLMPECCRPEDEKAFWDASLPLSIEGVPTHRLCPADQILHLCAHGLRWSQRKTPLWLADIAHVLRTQEVRWPRLLEQTRRRRLGMQVRAGLGLLSELLVSPAPKEVLRVLDSDAASVVERLEFAYMQADPFCLPLGYLPVLYFDYARRAVGAPAWRSVPGLARYLADFWGLETPQEVFAFLRKTLARRLHEWQEQLLHVTPIPVQEAIGRDLTHGL